MMEGKRFLLHHWGRTLRDSRVHAGGSYFLSTSG